MGQREKGADDGHGRHTPDILASFVVFLVALPLCIGIAVACGVPAERGLATGIVGGILVGSIAGAPLLVSGPAASLIVPVADLVQTHGLGALAPVVMLAGAWQVLAGIMSLGQWFRAVAPAVIHGMLIGIGVLICVSQLHIAIDAEPKATFVDNAVSFPAVLWERLAGGAGVVSAAPVLIAVATIALIVLWNAYKPPRLRLIPGHLVSLALVTTTVLVTEVPVAFLDVSPNFFAGLDVVGPSAFGVLLDPSVLKLSFVFAFVASAATLLTANAIDQRQSHTRTNYDREMLAQGVGNLVAGGVGGLPMTGVIVRSSVNVDAGARTRLSTILHGAWILLFVVAAPELLEAIPQSSLGAILVYTGYKLIDYRALVELYHRGRAELAIALITLVGVVFVDLFAGILAGLAAAVAKLVYTFARLDIRAEQGFTAYHLHMTGSATFLHLPRLATNLDRVPPDLPLHVHIDRLDHIDHACLELLSNWNRRRSNEGRPGMVVKWDELTERYRHALVGARVHGDVASRSLLSAMWAEWKKTYAPRYRFEASAHSPWNEWLAPSRIRTGLEASTIDDVLSAAADMLAPAASRSADEIAAALAGRIEDHVALGYGVSIPHCPVPALKQSIAALVTTTKPVDVGGETADVFFVLLAPDDDPQQHLRSLANVGRLCLDGVLVASLRRARTPEAAAQMIKSAEETPTRGQDDTSSGMLAVIEVGDEVQYRHAIQLLEEIFLRPVPLGPAEGHWVRTLQGVLGSPRDRQLVAVAIEARNIPVLNALLAEQSRITPEETWQLHLLRPEPIPSPR